MEVTVPGCFLIFFVDIVEVTVHVDLAGLNLFAADSKGVDIEYMESAVLDCSDDSVNLLLSSLSAGLAELGNGNQRRRCSP